MADHFEQKILVGRNAYILALAIIRRAILDARSGRVCDGKCQADGAHACAADALDFLQSPGCQDLAEMLDISGWLERLVLSLTTEHG